MERRGVAGGFVKKPTQREEVLNFMNKYGSISAFDAFTELGVTQLGARIKELEEESFQRKRRRSGVKRQLVFCTGGV